MWQLPCDLVDRSNMLRVAVSCTMHAVVIPCMLPVLLADRVIVQVEPVQKHVPVFRVAVLKNRFTDPTIQQFFRRRMQRRCSTTGWAAVGRGGSTARSMHTHASRKRSLRLWVPLKPLCTRTTLPPCPLCCLRSLLGRISLCWMRLPAGRCETAPRCHAHKVRFFLYLCPRKIAPTKTFYLHATYGVGGPLGVFWLFSSLGAVFRSREQYL